MWLISLAIATMLLIGCAMGAYRCPPVVGYPAEKQAKVAAESLLTWPPLRETRSNDRSWRR